MSQLLDALRAGDDVDFVRDLVRLVMLMLMSKEPRYWRYALLARAQPGERFRISVIGLLMGVGVALLVTGILFHETTGLRFIVGGVVLAPGLVLYGFWIRRRVVEGPPATAQPTRRMGRTSTGGYPPTGGF